MKNLIKKLLWKFFSKEITEATRAEWNTIKHYEVVCKEIKMETIKKRVEISIYDIERMNRMYGGDDVEIVVNDMKKELLKEASKSIVVNSYEDDFNRTRVYEMSMYVGNL